VIFTLILALAASFLIITSYFEDQKEIKYYSFTMDSADGKVSLSDFNGKYTIIYYGYMYCPDICPTSLSMTAEALKRLPKADADKFQLVFISVDPDRDKVDQLKEYATYFHPSAIGITSDAANIKEVANKYGTYYANEYLPNSKMDYSVTHTSFIYFMDKDGKLKHRISHVDNPEVVLEALKEVLK